MNLIRPVFSALATTAMLCLFAGVPAQSPNLVPPEPEVRPLISHPTRLDTNRNRLDDRFEVRLGMVSQWAALGILANAGSVDAALDEMAPIEMVFSSQIDQASIDSFLRLGGVIDHIYRHASYGWTGSIPLRSIPILPAAMGIRMVCAVGATPLQMHLDESTRSARARTVWQGGFANYTSGFRGSPNTTIAFVDTGIDDAHTDLAGRKVYWKDWTSDNEANPRDEVEHGTHVAGIALGTGASFDLNTSLLKYTDSGHLDFVPASSFLPSPIHLPVSTFNVSMIGAWVGVGTTQTHFLQGVEPTTTWTDMGGTSTGISPRSIALNSLSASAGRHFSTGLISNGQNNLDEFRVVTAITYGPVGDGFPSFSGIAPLCQWAGFKVFTNAKVGTTLDLGEAIDDIIAQRVSKQIKIANFSVGVTGSPGLDTTIRDKVNTLAMNGVLPVASVGNQGPLVEPSDPGRAALALSVGAINDVNQLTQYTTIGMAAPAANEDMKPDILAPGGSALRSFILAADSNDSDANSTIVGDGQVNDYKNQAGTSMAAPHVSGAAALVIQALESMGTVWDYQSDQLPRLVKMLLLASATETNAAREADGFDPPLGRNANPKDVREGYGQLNIDAAVEAARMSIGNSASSTFTGSTTGGTFDRRCWGRTIPLIAGVPVSFALESPSTGDFDLYLVSGTPDAKGNPDILAAGVQPGNGVEDTLSFTPLTSGTAYLFIKRVSGSGEWGLFTISDKPVLMSLAPNSIAVGASAFTLTCRGTNFSAASLVKWNGVATPTTYVNRRTITASISASDVAVAGASKIAVSGQAGDSNTLIFTIGQPNITISSISSSRSNGSIIYTVNVRNSGNAPAAVAEVRAATLRNMSVANSPNVPTTSTLPIPLGSLSPGATGAFTARFPDLVGTTGQTGLFRATIGFTSGQAGITSQRALP